MAGRNRPASFTRIARQLLDTYEAFDRFCRTRLGVDAKTLLNAWGFPVAGDFERTPKRLGFLKPDEGRVQEYLGLISAAWDRRFGPEPVE